ncbi:glycosyltransferase family 4 protein [Mucisphaera calidilacus]|uniref:D-inositol 3-phosphate glycosyltransferase n=1 Tax=Mucisphaera calidilacus TaxID=2527982 RepID=A0A518C0H8_9BACT|nr:glycosyltransferase family 4 protein [Mucisphaera calidilacus]QDU72728.1 D-inositol 3-phosphate glycosyltransferase [Mucisphaera calidilacus]
MAENDSDDATLSAPLRVLHLTAGSDAGGISRYLHVLCQELKQRGHQPVVAGEVGIWHDLFTNATFPWIEAPLKSGPIGLWRARATIARGLRNAGFDQQPPVDIIHAHYRKSSLVGRWLARRWRIPLVYTLHLTGIPLDWASNLLSDWGDTTHVPSSQAQQWLIDEAQLDPERIQRIPHGIHAERFPEVDDQKRTTARALRELNDASPVVAFVNRFDTPKNDDWVIDLADLSRDVAPNALFLMQGEGPHEPILRREIVDRRLQNRVRILPYGDPVPTYHAADLVIIPSALEGFSYVTTEAMSAGCAVLRTRTAGWEEHIIEGVNGRSCPIDREAFLAAGLELLQHPEQLRDMGHAAAAHVREHLTIDRQLSATVELYRKVIAQHRH